MHERMELNAFFNVNVNLCGLSITSGTGVQILIQPVLMLCSFQRDNITRMVFKN